MVKVGADLGRTKRMKRKRHDKARTGRVEAREGHSRIMPQKDMTEPDKVWHVST